MASNAIIEGLKQGNALELELVKKLKEGLGFVVDGMEKECYNRADALSELREELREEIANARAKASMSGKDELLQLLTHSYQECMLAEANSKTRMMEELRKAEVAFRADAEHYNKRVELEREQKSVLQNIGNKLDRLGVVLRPAHNVYEVLQDEYFNFKSSWIEGKDARVMERSVIYARREEREKNAREMHVEEKKVLQKEMVKLKHMLEIVQRN